MEITRENLLSLIKSGIKRDALSVAGLEKTAGVPKDTIRDFLRGKTQILRADKLQKILRILEPHDGVRIAGRIGAGGEIFFNHHDTSGEMVGCPPEFQPSDVVAVRVEGDAMLPIFYDKWIVYFARRSDLTISTIAGGWQVPYEKPVAKPAPTSSDRFAEFLGKPCVVGLHNGRVFAGTLKRGKENEGYDIVHYLEGTLKNVNPQWVAKIVFIKTE